MHLINRIKRYCGGSETLAWLTFGEVAIWLLVTAITLAGRLMHFYVPIAEWLTLPSYFPLFLSRPWTLISYMGIHFDVLHMIFNVLWLYWFGRILLITVPDRYLLLAFIGGGISGGIAFLAVSSMGYGTGWLCGCSAAVIAVMCVAAIRMPNHRINLFLIGEVKLKWVAAICCILTFLGGGGNQAAHIGGMIWGIISGIFLRQGFNMNRAQTRKADRMVKVLRDRQSDIQRLDELLDKIRLSGYGSLSHRERKELNEISSRIKK